MARRWMALIGASSLIFFMLINQAAFAAAGGRSDFLANLGSGISKKADDRYQSRWTLADWFETQRKSRLQDMWFANNHKEDIFEFFVGGRTGSITSTLDGIQSLAQPRKIETSLGAYATLAGIEGRYFDIRTSDADPATENGYGWEGLFALRPIGDSLQNTNITLLYGVQFRDEFGGETVQNGTAKARLTFYLTKAFGLEGGYQWVFKAASNQGADISGSAIDASVFLDFSLLRIYGAWLQESRSRFVSATSVTTERKREAVDFGLKLFF